MPDDKVDIGYGIKFERSSDGTDTEGSFVPCGTIESLTPPEITRDTVEITHNESAGGYREFIGGLLDAGEVSLSQHFKPGDATEMAALAADLNNAEPNYYRIVFKGGTKWTFKALLSSYSADSSTADKMMAETAYKLSGQPDFLVVA